MKFNIALVKGDGIGPEIVNGAVEVLEVIGQKYGHKFNFTEYLAGGCAIDACGEPLPAATVEGCKNSDSVLLGAVGGPKWDTLPGNIRPERHCSDSEARSDFLLIFVPQRFIPRLHRLVLYAPTSSSAALTSLSCASLPAVSTSVSAVDVRANTAPRHMIPRLTVLWKLKELRALRLKPQ